VAGSGGTWYYFNGQAAHREDLILHPVKYEKLQTTIVERGQLESAENSDILCRVKARSTGNTVATTIKWIIEDGSHVTRGQTLIELDDSGLQEQLKAQKIVVDRAYAEWIAAQGDLDIVESQNVSDLALAENTLKLMKIDLEKYELGDFLQSIKDIQGRESVAKSDLEMWKDRASWSERMLRKDYISGSQAEAERSKLRNAEITLAKVQEEMRVLKDYTYKRTMTDLTSKVEEAVRNLERVKIQAGAKKSVSATGLASKKSIYLQEQSKYEDIEDEINKCLVTAPQEGMVVYHLEERSRYSGSGSQQGVIAQGEPVREGQKLIRIPDLRRMQVNAKVHEAMVSRVKGEQWETTGFADALRAAMFVDPNSLSRMATGYAFNVIRDRFSSEDKRLVYGGQQAYIKVDAFPDRVLKGHVKSVATVASQADWMSSDVKVYQAIISIDEEVENLKPGMSAEVTVLIGDTRGEVLTIPLQAILGSPSLKARKCFVLTDAGPEERDIEIGMANDKMAEVRSGLKEGDQVIINPRLLLTEKDKLRPVTVTPGKSSSSDDQAGGGGDAGGGEGKKGKGKKGKGKGGAGAGGPGGIDWQNLSDDEKQKLKARFSGGGAPKDN
jgi:multidrug efflux pump subunit AcrA (membrane-fusion protein)